MVNKKTSVISDIDRNLELIEVKAWDAMYSAVPAETARQFGIKCFSTPTTCTTVVSTIDVLAFNRVVGLGIEEPITDQRLDEILTIYRQEKVPRLFLQLHPDIVTPETDELLTAKGFYHYNNWEKLYRPIEPIPEAKSDLRIEKIDDEHADAFADILVTAFEWPQDMKAWVAASVGLEGWHHYMAFDKDKPAATAGFFLEGEYAWIDFASTLSEYRGRGAQGALVERRIRDAKDMGCRWLVVETAQQTPEKEAPSYRNMIRYGFKLAYTRPNYIFEF